MDERVINELIKQLTESLEKVESARQQVEKVVEAYDVLKTEVSKYTTELSFITQNVRTMISQLEDIREKFLGNISTKIVDEIHHAVSTITSAIDGISSQISSLYDLTDTRTKQIDGTLNRRADNVDTTLSTIRTELNSIDAKVTSCSNQLEQLVTLVNSLKVDEKTHFESIAKQMEEQEERIDVVIKQNKYFSIIIIVLLLVIISLIIFML